MRSFAIVFMFSILAHGQGPGTPKNSDEKAPHLDVEVTLDNGARFRGIVLNRVMVELPFRAVYKKLEDDQKKRPGAGIRLWYYQQMRGFMFLTYRQIKSVKVKGTMTESQVLSRKKSIDEAANRRRASGSAKAPRKKPGALESVADGLTDAQRKLIDRFAPTKGWTADRYEKIQRDRILFGTDPVGEEAEWLKVYPEWLAARRAFETGAKAAKRARLVKKKLPATAAKKKSGRSKTARKVRSLDDAGRKSRSSRRPASPGRRTVNDPAPPRVIK